MRKFPEYVDLSMGGGGKRMDLLIDFIGKHIGITNGSEDLVGPKDMDDAAVIQSKGDPQIVLTTDAHTVDPIFFKGGNIGDLAIAGTVNDVMVMGAEPKYLTLSMVIEDGYAFADIKKICETMGTLARQSGVRIVAGDTKVMPKGAVSNIIVTTAGYGEIIRKKPLKDSQAVAGDCIIVSGTVGDHGAALMSQREGIELETELESDVAPLWPQLKDVLLHPGVKAMKDVTRGGLASALNEIADKSNVCLEVVEEDIPIRPESQAICDILGLEPLEITSEGKVIIIVSADARDDILRLLHKHDVTLSAKQIGTVKASPEKQVHVITDIGGTRLLDKPYGEPIPRVC